MLKSHQCCLIITICITAAFFGRFWKYYICDVTPLYLVRRAFSQNSVEFGWYSQSEWWLQIKAGAESLMPRVKIWMASSRSCLYLGCKRILMVALAIGQLFTCYPNAYTPCPIPHLHRMLMESLSDYSALTRS